MNSHSASLKSVELHERQPDTPQAIEGLSFSEQWTFNHGIEDVSDVIDTYKIKHYGTIETKEVVLEDGSVYRVHSGRPFDSKRKMDQLSLKTTAFLTKDNTGFNRHHQIKEVEAGFMVDLVSREIKWKGELSQARTAHNMLKIGRLLLDQDDSIDQKNIQARGISRGAMLAMGATALSQNNPNYDLDIFYFSATAPCYPEPLKISPKYLRMPLFETSSLLYHVGKMPLNALTHYPSTIDTNLDFAVKDALALVNGDAGKFVEHLDPDQTRGYLLGYPDDIMGMGKVWQKLFAQFSEVSVDLDSDRLMRVFDGHLRVVSHHDLTDALKRQLRLAEEYKTHNQNLDAIDYNFVSAGRG